MAIDPAQSFSNALGQGLGIMKSYRDEARLDEDRSFEKSMKLETQRQAQEQLNLLIKGDKREQMKFDEDMTPERVALRGRKAVADVNLTEAQATDAGILASKRGKMIDTDIEVAKGNLDVNRYQAQTGRMNAVTSRGELGLRTRAYNDERADLIANKALQAGWQSISAAAKNPTAENMRSLMGNKIAGSALIKLASKAYDAPILEEIMQNPFGNWINDGKKLGVALRFARETEVVNATVKAQGFDPKTTRATRFRGATQKDANGRPMQMVEVTLSGKDLKTGKNKTFTGFVKPETLFESGAVAANVFKGINNDPILKGRLAQMYQATNEDKFYKILNYEATRLEKEIKKPSHPDVLSGKLAEDEYIKAAQRRLAALENGDPEITANTVFRYMGRMGS
jgi:hypothetical protein